MADQDDVQFIKEDLAPGDARSATLDLRTIRAHRIASPSDPLFDAAYAALWNEFGAAAEIEQQDVLARRLADNATQAVKRYEMIVLREGDDLVAVRDHQAVMAGSSAVVHLSHSWVHPKFRRTGLAGWLRAFPIQTARHCLIANSIQFNPVITLVAEMEHPDVGDPARMIRLAAYEKAGFRKVDPRAFDYLQPDFRPTAKIDADGAPRPLPFALILRRVGREAEAKIAGEELRLIVTALYRIYDADFRKQDMQPLWEHLIKNDPANHAEIDLVAPTSDSLSRVPTGEG